ncbi:hypothetical protein [Flavihumibacter fluvii]|uniref:hypothetical protein n=1 Tax=Flavihumibacter fluvii TaxID=2838157 RepID=UPI001BDF2190|nr:hypothetical protein [Flavihumibacter fluvii]ULQ54106.1 hypothetical protein KJS93_07205 [Flavihumibacter fluvii]
MANLSAQSLPFWKSLQIQLKSRNKLLYYVTLFSLTGAAICFILIFLTSQEVRGVNAYIKPFKFFASIAVTSFTLAWVMVYLKNQKAVRVYSRMLAITMFIELVIITGQAALGHISHFATEPLPDVILFQVMGLAITTFTLWTGWICICFFRQKEWPIWMSEGYLWGIRLGLLFFVVFALEGFYMVVINQHTIGAPDGQPGFPLTNWSRQNGDLRIPHFFGLHTLQLFPLLGYYIFPKKNTMIIMAITWFTFIVLLLWQAIKGFPIIP